MSATIGIERWFHVKHLTSGGVSSWEVRLSHLAVEISEGWFLYAGFARGSNTNKLRVNTARVVTGGRQPRPKGAHLARGKPRGA